MIRVQRLTFADFVDSVLNRESDRNWAEQQQEFKLLQAVGTSRRRSLVVYFRNFPAYTNNPNWHPEEAEQAGEMARVPPDSHIRVELLDWMDPDTTLWDRQAARRHC
jgi:hypothetical protein